LAGTAAMLLVWRQGIAVYHRALESSERAALERAARGVPFGLVCDSLSAAGDAETAAARAFAWLSTWLADGLLAVT
jgi:hypothetical protein